MGSAQLTEGLTASNARWRSSRLGEITDTLEQQLLFELAGPVAGKRLLDVGCGDAALASEFAGRGAVVTGGHAVLKTLCGYDPTRLIAFAGRFSAPVFPGETIRTEMWRDGAVVSFRARVVERDVIAINNGRAEVKP
jgi:hypothetical protein